MRCLLAFVAVCFLGLQSGRAADITEVAASNSEHPALILIKGILGKEERVRNISRFRALTFDQRGSRAIVFLDSLGGDVRTAIAIGRLIREHMFSTVVAENGQM